MGVGGFFAVGGFVYGRYLIRSASLQPEAERGDRLSTVAFVFSGLGLVSLLLGGYMQIFW